MLNHPKTRVQRRCYPALSERESEHCTRREFPHQPDALESCCGGWPERALPEATPQGTCKGQGRRPMLFAEQKMNPRQSFRTTHTLAKHAVLVQEFQQCPSREHQFAERIGHAFHQTHLEGFCFLGRERLKRCLPTGHHLRKLSHGLLIT